MMARGSSVRGLSEVSTVRSAYREAAAPIRGRLPLSRQPPQPNTAMSRPEVRDRAVFRAFSMASGVWAKSMNTR